MTAQKYTLSLQLLHWVMAGVLVYLLFFSEFEDLPGEEVAGDMVVHAGLGLTVPLLALIRMALRRWQPDLPDLPGPAWQHRAAKAVHHAFYALFFLVPIAGIVLGTVATYPVVAFGILDIGALGPDNADRMGWMRSVHGFLADLIKYLLIAHIGAVAFHHVRHRVPVLKRMVPGW